MADSDARAIGNLEARVHAIELRQGLMEERQEQILEGLAKITSQLDRAAGGATVIRWLMGFLGLGSLGGCIAFAMSVYDAARMSR